MATYAFQSLIEAQQYNNLVWGSSTGGTLVTGTNNLNMLWGPGYGAKGINQSMSSVAGLPNNAGLGTVTVGQNIIAYDNTTGTLNQVAASGVVTSQQWIGLISATNNLLSYQGLSQYSLTTPPGIQQKISAYDQIQTYLNNIAGSMGTGGSPVAQVVTGAAQSVSWSAPAGSTATRTLTATTSIQWPTGNDIRWFFNAGGYITISVSGQGSATDRSSAVANMLNNLGYLTIYAKSCGGTMLQSGQPFNSIQGYWGSWGTNNAEPNLLVKSTTSGQGVYTNSYASASVKLFKTGVNGANGGANGNTIQITVFVNSTTASAFTDRDNINATLNVVFQVFDPAAGGSFPAISKTWGSPSVNSITSSTT